MATPEEIRQRVEQADIARSARRAAAAQQIGELVQSRAAIVEQLEDVERELGDVIADAQDVIGVEELAEFTDVKAADLTQWLAGRKTTRAKRKKPAASASRAQGEVSRRPSAPGTPPAGQASAPREPALAATGSPHTAERVAAEVT